MTYGTHPFVPMIGDDGRPTDYCERCGSHRRAHEPPPPPPAPPQPAGPEPEPALPLAPMRAPSGEVVFTMAHIAALAGVGVGTVRWHRSRGSLPEADGRVGNVPYWRRETILPWILSRPKPGNPGWHKGMPSPGPRG